MILAGVRLKAALYANDNRIANSTISEILGVSEETIRQTLSAHRKAAPTSASRMRRSSPLWAGVIATVTEMVDAEIEPNACAMATGKPYTYESKHGTVYVRPDGISLPYIRGLYEET